MFGESCSCEWLSETLQAARDTSEHRLLLQEGRDGAGILLLDCRSADEYNASHVLGSILVTIPSILFRRLKNGNGSVSSVIASDIRDSFTTRWKTSTVVLYDSTGTVAGTTTEGISVPPSSGAVMSLLKSRLEKDGCQVRCLQGKILFE